MASSCTVKPLVIPTDLLPPKPPPSIQPPVHPPVLIHINGLKDDNQVRTKNDNDLSSKQNSENAINELDKNCRRRLDIGAEPPPVLLTIKQIQATLIMFRMTLSEYRTEVRYYNLSNEQADKISERVTKVIMLCSKDSMPYSTVIGAVKELLCYFSYFIKHNERDGVHYEKVRYIKDLDTFEILCWNFYYTLQDIVVKYYKAL